MQMVPEIYFKWCWADKALSIWLSQVFKEIKNFWDVSTMIMPVSASSVRGWVFPVLFTAISQHWDWHTGKLHSHLLTKYMKKWTEHLLSELRAFHLFLHSTLIFSQLKGSCHNSSKEAFAGSERTFYQYKVISSPETIMLIQVFFSDHLQNWAWTWKSCHTLVDHNQSGSTFQMHSPTHHTKYGTYSPSKMLCGSEWYWATEFLWFFSDHVSLWSVFVLVVMLWNQFGVVLQLDQEVMGYRPT